MTHVYPHLNLRDKVDFVGGSNVRIVQNTGKVETIISKPVQRGHVDEGVGITTKKKMHTIKERKWVAEGLCEEVVWYK